MIKRGMIFEVIEWDIAADYPRKKELADLAYCLQVQSMKGRLSCA